MSHSVPPPLPELPGKHSSESSSPAPELESVSKPIKLQAPDDIESFKLHVIQELSSSKELMQGLFETSPEGEEIYAKQKQLAEANIAKAEVLLTKLEELQLKRSATEKMLAEHKELETEWTSIEQQMYRALQPFSLPSLKSKLEYATKDSESMSNVLASSFLDGSNTESVKDFIKNYRKERTTYHLRKERLQRWNEDRVSQI